MNTRPSVVRHQPIDLRQHRGEIGAEIARTALDDLKALARAGIELGCAAAVGAAVALAVVAVL